MSNFSKKLPAKVDTLSRMTLVSLFMLSLVLSGAQPSTPSIKDVAWIAGCWETDRNGRHVMESWLPPEGGTMMGVSRTVAGTRTTEWEFLLIREGDGRLEYVAKPSGQTEATFTATRASAR